MFDDSAKIHVKAGNGGDGAGIDDVALAIFVKLTDFSTHRQVVTIFMFRFIYGKNLSVSEEDRKAIMELKEANSIRDPKLFKKSIVMILLVVFAFMFHKPGTIVIEPNAP